MPMTEIPEHLLKRVQAARERAKNEMLDKQSIEPRKTHIQDFVGHKITKVTVEDTALVIEVEGGQRLIGFAEATYDDPWMHIHLEGTFDD